MTTTKKAMGAVVMAAVGMFAVPATAELPKAGPVPTLSPTALQPVTTAFLAPVSLGCQGMGASDVRHRGHEIKNTAGATIPKGTVVRWTSSDKGSGNVTLAADLAPNATIDVIESGQTNGYTCTASFSPGNADYVVASVAWTGPSSARIVVKNQNAFADAPATTVALATKKCLTTLVARQVVKVDAIPKGGSRTLDIGAVSHAGDYLEATVNPGGEQPESNKTNNTQRSVEFSTNKSCTPQ